MSYDFRSIDQKWQSYWQANETFKTALDNSKPKFYILDMFPYPSGAGLHVGHPLGYIASDIYTRYKRLKGFNVLHPMGYDAFGLPAEQYAIQTGQHPAKTTQENAKRYRKQLDRIGFSFDWSREFKTCDSDYYKWTQWAFGEMFNHYFCLSEQKAKPIDLALKHLKEKGTDNLKASGAEDLNISANAWQSMEPVEQEEVLGHIRLAYLANVPVNWCAKLGTVLANDEVKDGLSVRGGHPVEQKMMKQWCLRVGAYAKRLLDSLESLEWSESIKEVQRNWIGRSEGAEVTFKVDNSDEQFDVFTTRPDTIFGVTFMVLAPESELVSKLTSKDQQSAVDDYLDACKKKSQRERMTDVKTVSGVFTGGYCLHPVSGEKIPVWIGDYVIGGYGTGAVMAVPAHDGRDHAFAKKFSLPIIAVVAGEGSDNVEHESYDGKDGVMINSDLLNGMPVKKAIAHMIDHVEAKKLGTRKINFRLRDAIFSRQRYWGEPFPVYYVDGLPHILETKDLPLELPDIDAYLPTQEGDPPLGRAENWQTKDGHPLELSTMPGFAGSSAYYLRYMDPHNDDALTSKEAREYWRQVDLYFGGSEHATGHLIYARFWNKFLFDIGESCEQEPFKKMINQGMIQGRSNFVYRLKSDTNSYVSHGLIKDQEVQEIHVDVNIVENDILDLEAFKKWRPEFAEAKFTLESHDGRDIYRCGHAVEKMSKSMFNVVNPDVVVERYGADTLRLYEMFLGPLEQSKPWNTSGIEGVYRFLIKFWNLFHDGEKFGVSANKATDAELKVLHTCIKKITEDIENFSFNTSVAAFMIATNDLGKLKCGKKEILEPLVVLLSTFAPHTSEELWQLLGHQESITYAKWPALEAKYLVESDFNYPISFNGKMKFLLKMPLNLSKDDIEKTVMAASETQKFIADKTIKKVIVVPKKIVNIVVG
jgi:leucyl-tRNA synthetase